MGLAANDRGDHPHPARRRVLFCPQTDCLASPHRSASEEVRVAAPTRFRVDNGDALHDWCVAGHGIMLKSWIDVAGDVRAGRLEHVLPEWTGGAAPIVALYPSSRHLPIKTRLFLDAMAARLSGH